MHSLQFYVSFCCYHGNGSRLLEKTVKYATLNAKIFIVGIVKSIFFKFKVNEQSSLKNFIQK